MKRIATFICGLAPLAASAAITMPGPQFLYEPGAIEHPTIAAAEGCRSR